MIYEKPNVTQGAGGSSGAPNATPVYDEKEEQAILDLCARQGLTRTQLLRQALREYQMNVIGPVDLGPKLLPSDASPVPKGLWTVVETMNQIHVFADMKRHITIDKELEYVVREMRALVELHNATL